MSTPPVFSVIVPAHQAAHLLPETLAALAASDLPRERWELIVVDDASRDDTAVVAAQWADRVVRLDGLPRGPGGARNEGARAATGAWLVFIDADVRVHEDTLRRMLDHVDRDPALVALFGSYDAHPAARGLVTEYRNLLHRYVHCCGAGEAETFWAGCGAVRGREFAEVGGFDTERFPRPQIEDIDLGYRLRDRGGRIVLDPSIQGTHLKRWTFSAMLRTDLLDRGIPWMLLLLERRGRRGRSSQALNTGRTEQLKVCIAALAAIMLVAAAVLGSVQPLILSALLFVVLATSNLPTYAWFARHRGIGFSLAVIPMHLAYYVNNAIAAAVGFARHLMRERVMHASRA